MKSLWRIIQRKYAEEAFSGEGSAKYGARWNQKGTAVVYCSESASLAQLEVLVRTQRTKDLALYVLIEARVPEELIETLRREDLPDDWNALPESNTTREIGTKWATEKRSAVLAVPSVVIPSELNFLLNPEHPELKRVGGSACRRVGGSVRGERPGEADRRIGGSACRRPREADRRNGVSATVNGER